jgi:PII-like signaling protein
MANNHGTPEYYQSLLNRVENVREKTKSDTTVMQKCIVNFGKQNLKLQKDLVDVRKLAEDVRKMTVPIITASEEKSEKIAQVLNEVTRAKTRILENQPTTVDFPVVCPHHRNHRIILEVQKQIHTSTNGVPTEHYCCPFKLSKSCKNQTLRDNWKNHIKTVCLPRMICKKSNNPNADCGPEPEAL